MTDPDGTARLLYTRVCRPKGDTPARAAVINHGTGVSRAILEPASCDAEATRWFLDRGYMVVMPIRRGYGATGGIDSAFRASGPDGLNNCNDLQPATISLEGARDIAAAVDYATALPGARPDGAVVLGASTGGYLTMAYNSLPHPKVTAFIAISGGIGGRFGGRLGQVCHPERMIDGAAQLGRTAATPNAVGLCDQRYLLLARPRPRHARRLYWGGREGGVRGCRAIRRRRPHAVKCVRRQRALGAARRGLSGRTVSPLTYAL